MKLTLVILGVFAVAIAVATFLEVRYGTDGARALVYNARWFEVLLALLIVNLCVSLVVHLPYHVRQTGYLITHIGFIVVLIAAGITRYFGYEGRMPIREGRSSNYMYSDRDHIAIGADGEQSSFPVRLFKPGHMSLHRNVDVGGERYRVTLTEYLPHYEDKVVEGAGGKPVVVLSTAADAVRLWAGDRFELGGVEVHFLRKEVPPTTRQTTYGDLVITFEGEEHHLPVSRDAGAETAVRGYRYRITEFAPAYRVGETPDPNDPMDNPAIRVEVTTPTGDTHEQLLFA
jgi:hypothetical protein